MPVGLDVGRRRRRRVQPDDLDSAWDRALLAAAPCRCAALVATSEQQRAATASVANGRGHEVLCDLGANPCPCARRASIIVPAGDIRRVAQDLALLVCDDGVTARRASRAGSRRSRCAPAATAARAPRRTRSSPAASQPGAQRRVARGRVAHARERDSPAKVGCWYSRNCGLRVVLGVPQRAAHALLEILETAAGARQARGGTRQRPARPCSQRSRSRWLVETGGASRARRRCSNSSRRCVCCAQRAAGLTSAARRSSQRSRSRRSSRRRRSAALEPCAEPPRRPSAIRRRRGRRAPRRPRASARARRRQNRRW